jgi:chromosomal replication initiator protein
LFEKIKQLLREGEDTLNYNRYLKNLKLNKEKSSSDLIIIEVPNIYIATYLKRHYSQKIANIVKEEINITPKIEFITNNLEENRINYSESLKKEIYENSSTLISEYTFKSFVEGENNLVAFNISKNVAENPATLYNPLFIYGGVGLGKTHLLQAIGNYLKDSKTITYVTSEQFMNEFTFHIRNNSMNDFHKKYRKCDLLLIDDIQFFADREKTQEEFFHTFNELVSNKKQICVTADRHPKQIMGIDKRITTRFEQGIITEIQPPKLDTKIAIIRKKCEINNISLPDDVIHFIATSLNNNIREIEGMITQTYAMANMVGAEITLDFTKEIFKEQINNKDIDLDTIIKLISKEFNLKPSEIKSKSRKQAIVSAKRTGIYLARELTKNSTTKIAQHFGLKDHSAVSHAIKVFNQKMTKDKDFQDKIEELKNKIKDEFCELCE